MTVNAIPDFLSKREYRLTNYEVKKPSFAIVSIYVYRNVNKPGINSIIKHRDTETQRMKIFKKIVFFLFTPCMSFSASLC